MAISSIALRALIFSASATIDTSKGVMARGFAVQPLRLDANDHM